MSVKTGSFSQYAPQRLQERIRQAEEDRELLSTRPALAVLVVRAQDLISRVDQDETQADAAVWGELRDTLRDLARLQETEQKRMLASEAYVTLQQFSVFLAALRLLIEEHVPDSKARARIAAGLWTLCNRQPPALKDVTPDP